ncbi:hypothetical protein [Chlamydia sp. 17-3921]|uniref:hypothetical protein n=1 Tax=Chlamydia sp. 17-3921 TaxID=2675798 RepID=UPI0019183ECE|nr:hypothetical protein [Chlamydia sp. 17-3921]
MSPIIIVLSYAISVTLACIFPSLIVYALLFRKESLAPKKHFRRFQVSIFLMALLAILISVSTMTPKRNFIFSRTLKPKKTLSTPAETTISSIYSMITIWACIEPFVLCWKARRVKDHYANLASKLEKNSCSS